MNFRFVSYCLVFLFGNIGVPLLIYAAMRFPRPLFYMFLSFAFPAAQQASKTHKHHMRCKWMGLLIERPLHPYGGASGRGR